jgi:hypothetical protein
MLERTHELPGLFLARTKQTKRLCSANKNHKRPAPNREKPTHQGKNVIAIAFDTLKAELHGPLESRYQVCR